MYQLQSCVVAGVQPDENFTGRESIKKGLATTVLPLTFWKQLYCMTQPRDMMFGVGAQNVDARPEESRRSREWSIIVQACRVPRSQDVVRPRE
jgi:hypothetical protein